MKSYLNLCAEVMVLIPLMISGPGCAQTYVPRRYYGTTYTAVPRVYTCQPAVTYRQPVVTYSQPRAAEISRQIERQTAEIEARVKRQTQEIEERVRRQRKKLKGSLHDRRRRLRGMWLNRQEVQHTRWQLLVLVGWGMCRRG